MMNLLKFILSSQLRRSGINRKISGFTLIELLVAMILAFLVITPLMTFMISILDSDRREQAKASSEQEIQASLDYIARDLQQAVYIYDNDGLTKNHTDTPLGIKDQIPPIKGADSCNSSNASYCQPVLVFWKREFISGSVGVSSDSDTNTDDGFAYSLVAYYLITNPNSNSTWSPSARIGRFQLRGKVSAANANTTKGKASDTGFNPPPLDLTISGAALKDKMNQWQSSLTGTATYSQPVFTLVDYIYSNTGAPSISCRSGQQGIGTSTSGFYACVDATNTLAQVYLRGNAFVRLNNNNNTQYTVSTSTYFPSANIQVQGRGFLFTK